MLKKINNYIEEYTNYLKNNKEAGSSNTTDPIPRLILLLNIGLIGVGDNKKSAKIAADIGQHG